MSPCTCPSGIAYFVFGVIATVVILAVVWALASCALARDIDNVRPPGSGGYQPKRTDGDVQPPPGKP